MKMSEGTVLDRTPMVRRGRRLEYFTIAWNSIEGLVAVVSGVIAGSISLVGFGIDSLIEVTSGFVLLWRMSVDADVERRDRNERRALKVVGTCFLSLAAYIAYESAADLWSVRAAALEDGLWSRGRTRSAQASASRPRLCHDQPLQPGTDCRLCSH